MVRAAPLIRARRCCLAVLLLLGLGWLWALSGTARAEQVATPFAQCAVAGGPEQQCGTGWYTSPVSVTWNTNGNTTVAGCATQFYSQDTDQSGIPDAALPPWAFCTAMNGDATLTIRYRIRVEVSSPAASVVPARAPDFNGWYNHSVAGSATGTAFSGIQSCTAGTYAGPDSAAATLSATCVDNAAKVASAVSAPFAYDATPPPVAVTSDAGDGFVILHPRAPAGLSSFVISRAPGLHGAGPSILHLGITSSFRDTHVRDGIRYRYTITARDQAGNTTVRSLTIAPGPRLLTPASNAATSTPPVLRWTAVRRATYYNVQLYRGGGKVLSTWPSVPHLRLKRAWTYNGRRYRLRRGRYHWYVWPGFGARAAARYGRLIGSRWFVVR